MGQAVESRITVIQVIWVDIGAATLEEGVGQQWPEADEHSIQTTEITDLFVKSL